MTKRVKLISIVLFLGMIYSGWGQNTGKALLYEDNFSNYNNTTAGVLPSLNAGAITNPAEGVWYSDRSMMWLKIDNCSSSGYASNVTSFGDTANFGDLSHDTSIITNKPAITKK